MPWQNALGKDSFYTHAKLTDIRTHTTSTFTTTQEVLRLEFVPKDTRVTWRVGVLELAPRHKHPLIIGRIYEIEGRGYNVATPGEIFEIWHMMVRLPTLHQGPTPLWLLSYKQPAWDLSLQGPWLHMHAPVTDFYIR